MAGVAAKPFAVHRVLVAERFATSRLASIALVVLVPILATWHLATSPPPWYDEGINLQAARTLAQSGQYGLVYAHELRPYNRELTTGPTVIAPVALAFKAFGVGLTQARLVMVVYSLLATLGLYRVAVLLYGRGVGVLAVFVLCATDRASPAFTRDVIGEVAALAFLFWAAVVFSKARATGQSPRYLAAGLLFGLAVLTKGQFGLLLPAIIVVWLLTRARPCGFSTRQLLLTLVALIAPQALWQLHQLVSLGPTGFMDHLGDQSNALSGSAMITPLSKALSGIRFLSSSHWATLALAGLSYVWLAVLRCGWRNAPPEQLVLPTFATLWVLWYVGLSIGYDRYAVPLMATGSVFLAVLIWHAIREPIEEFRRPGGRTWQAFVGDRLQHGLLLVPAALVVSGIASHVAILNQPQDVGAQRMGALITEEVDSNATVYSIEWQLDALTEHAINHSPGEVVSGEYIVDGPTSKQIRGFNRELAEHNYRRIAEVGIYDLYVRLP